MKIKTTFFLLALILLISGTLTFATRPEPNESSKEKSYQHNNNNNNKKGGGNDGGGMGGFFGPGGGINIPGVGTIGGGGGYGFGYGGPEGGYNKGGTVRPSMVCKDKGPCYKKKLTCPAKCFNSFSRSGKGYGGGGGGGGCTMDCKKCVAYC